MEEILYTEVNLGLYALPSFGGMVLVAPVVTLDKILKVPVGIYFETDLLISSDLLFEEEFIVGLFLGIGDAVEINLGYNFNQAIVGYVAFGF